MNWRRVEGESRSKVLRAKYPVLSKCYRVVSVALATISLGSAPAAAAPPKVNNLFPAGAQRGQSITVTAAGDFSTWPVPVWADRPGLTFIAEKDKGKFKVDVASDAAAGIYWLRMHNADGASVPRPFVIGTLPEVTESETNDAPDKPQVVEPRVVVNGKLGKTNDVDSFRVELKQNQTLVASLEANSRLGSPMDAVLQICELSDRLGRTEAYIVSQNHDAVGLDPQIAFTADHDGAYLVRLFAFPATPDSSVRFAGGDDYIYRLTLTTGPFIDHVLPLAVPREEGQIAIGGWNLGRTATTIVPPLSASTDALTPPDEPLVWIWRPDAAGAVLVPRVEFATQIEKSEMAAPPMTVSGRLAAVGQVNSYSFPGQKEKKLRFKVAAKSLGYPTDAAVTIVDEAGKTLAEADDASRDDRDPTLDFTPPADGIYRLLVRDLANRGDVRMVYRLTAEPVEPDYAVTLAADAFVIEKGKPLELPINIAVRDGLKEPIEFHVAGLPAGVTAEPLKFEPSGDAAAPMNSDGRRGKRGGSPQPSAPSAKLVLKADSTAQPGGFPIRITGQSAGASPKTRTARFSLNLPLAGSQHAVWITVK